MKAFNQYILEKLKVTKGNNKTGEELFYDVIDALKHYGGGLDVKPLKLICYQFKEDYSFKKHSIDNIYYSYTSKTKKDWMLVMLVNGSSIRIDDFETFKNKVLSENKESSEEILNNILDLISNG